MKLDFLDYIFEAGEGPRIPHPEDSIFAGSAAATASIGALKEIIANPGKGSIKWDGGIALFFGRNQAGQFVCADKYMPAKGVYPTSPEAWVEYDRQRGADRSDLYAKIELIWPGLEAAVGSTQGLFKGDLMWTGVLQPQDGQYVFGPVTVQYRIPVGSALGKLVAGKVGGLVVHQFNDAPWDGKSGLTNAGNVAILTPTAGITFTLKNPVKLVSDAEKAVAGQGKLADDFMAGLAGTVKSAIQTYMNKKITKQTNDELVQWLPSNVSNKQVQLLIGANNDGYLMQNEAGLTAVFAIWNAIYRLKDNLCQQLEPQVKGFEQWTGGQKAGEGFVFPTSQGLIKLVNRAGFGAAHFNK
jgi:hypothetical protein